MAYIIDHKCLPMLATAAEEVSPQRVKQIVSHLSAPDQLRKLATDLRFLKQQSGLLHSMYGHLRQACSNEQACRQLLSKVPQLLRQLVAITTAVLQQLAVQRDREVQVSRAAVCLAAALAELLPVAKGWQFKQYDPMAPADTATLRMVHSAGGCEGSMQCTDQRTPWEIKRSGGGVGAQAPPVHSCSTPVGSPWVMISLCCVMCFACRPRLWLMPHVEQ
jgi:hypothetical protein